MDNYRGYREEALSVLTTFNAQVWSDVEVRTDQGTFTGIVLPRSETADAGHIVLKLRSGYNVGVAASRVQAITVQGRTEAHYKIPEKEFPVDPAKPRVKLFGTGGTIASRLDYRTGAVIPAFSPGSSTARCPSSRISATWRPRSSTGCSARTWGRNSGSAPRRRSGGRSSGVCRGS